MQVTKTQLAQIKRQVAAQLGKFDTSFEIREINKIHTWNNGPGFEVWVFIKSTAELQLVKV